MRYIDPLTGQATFASPLTEPEREEILALVQADRLARGQVPGPWELVALAWQLAARDSGDWMADGSVMMVREGNHDEWPGWADD